MLSVEAIDLYYGAAQALRGVSLKATVGRVTCVLGRNGVGKSSLLRAIVGHHVIAAGSIRWMDEEISGRRRICGPGAASASCRRGARSFRC